MNILVHRCQGDCRYSLLDSCVDFFRAGVARHCLHDLIKNLALVSCGEPMLRTKFTEGDTPDAWGGLHQELVNDNYYCHVKRREA
jgi:hypothetical protein